MLDKISYYFLLVLMNFIGNQALSAQNSGVQGNVLDENGAALPFANIFDLETQKGTQSNEFGFFKLPLTKGEHLLVFTFVGYKNDTIAVNVLPNEFAQLNVLLKAKNTLLNTVVVSGSRYEKPLSKITVSLDLVKPSLIENANNTSIEQSIEKVPGINVIDGQANIRGGSGYSYGAGSRVLLLLDGMPLLTGDASFPYWNLVPVESTGQIEIIKGAASTLYGSTALNGVVNVRTIEPTLEPTFKFSTFGTVYQNPMGNNEIDIDTLLNGTIRRDSSAKNWWGNSPPHTEGASFSYANTFNKIGWVSSASVFNEKSWRQTEYEKRIRLHNKFTFTPKENSPWKISLGALFQYTDIGSFFLWNGDGADGYRHWDFIDNTENIRTQLVTDFIVNRFSKTAKHRFQIRNFYSFNKTERDQDLKTDLLFAEYQFQKRFPGLKGVLTTGLVQTNTWVDAELYGDQKFTGNNGAAYAQWEQSLGKKLNYALGVRYEANRLNDEDWDAKPVFRLGLNYEILPFTFLRTSFGQGYRFPTIAEKFVDTELGLLTIAGNSDLKSETGWSTEIGAKQGIQIGNWQGFFDAALFWMEYQEMMEFSFVSLNGVPAFQTLNTGNTRITGGEVSLTGRGKIGDWTLETLIGHTRINPIFLNFDEITESRSSADYNVLKYRFRDNFKGDVQIGKGSWSGGISARYNSEMEAIDQAFVDINSLELSEYFKEHPFGEWVWDFRIQKRFGKKHQVALLVNNFMNNEYTIRPAMFEAPRSFGLKYSYSGLGN